MKKPILKPHSRIKAAAIALFAMAAISTTQAAEKKLFWSETSSINTMNLDGTEESVLLKGLNVNVQHIDAANGVMYWWDAFSHNIYRSDMDGGNRVVIYTLPPSYESLPDLILDDTGERLFCTMSVKGIISIELATGEVEWIIENARPGTLKFDNGRLFWNDHSAGFIESMNPDGSDRQQIIAHKGIRCYTMDYENDVIYYGDGTTMMKVNYDGTEQAELFKYPNSWWVQYIEYLQDRLYIVDAGGDCLISCDLNGNDVKELYNYPERAGHLDRGSDNRIYGSDPIEQIIFSFDSNGEDKKVHLQGGGVGTTKALAIDEENETLYAFSSYRILGKTADLEGTPVSAITKRIFDTPKDISFSTDKMYWVDEAGSIMYSDFDGSNRKTFHWPISIPLSIFIDDAKECIYVLNIDGLLLRSDFAISTKPDLLCKIGNQATSIFVYSEIGRIFFIEEESKLISCAFNGSDKQVLATTDTTFGDFTIDKESNTIFWSEGAEIYSADLAGSTKELLHESDNVSYDNTPLYLALGTVGPGTDVEESFACNDISYWEAVSGDLSLNSNSTEGTASLELSEFSGSIEVKTVPLASADFVNTSKILAVDLFVGANEANQWWLGAVQIIFQSVEAGIWYADGGTVQLGSLEKSAWNTLNFYVPLNVKQAMRGDYSDITVTFKFNTASGADDFLIDNMRFQ